MDSVSFKDGNLSAKLVPNGVLKGFMSVSEYCYDYNGSYTATPTNEEQIFETKEKRMADNFTVMPIPFDLSSDTVEPEKLLYNVTAHDKAGNAIVGTMPDNGVADGIISKKNDVYSVQEGYYEGGTVQISQDEQDKIVSDNIREGVTILGVAGNVTGPDDSASVLDSLITRNITEISNNRVTSIGNYTFQSCKSLTTADFPLVTSIGSYAFQSCTSLTTLILHKSDAICTLSSTNVFNSTAIKSGTGYIYVPSALVESYKSATNWSTYADQIRAIEDYPEITGG